MRFFTIVFGILFCTSGFSQDFRWQQRVEYSMDVHLNVSTHKVTGFQKLVYYNNSPDTLTKVYYHLYFNAFQPGSMMDVRSRNISDPDSRVLDRISKLKDDEIGYQKIQSLKQDGKEINYHVEGTVMEVTLAKALLPKSKTIFEMKFESQVPVQIRRSGRNNKEGISYSMTQWYPKMAEYDFQGWHAYQYVGREFHSVWGDFDVKITLDPSFIIAGTGKLQNPDKIGYGYEKSGTKVTRPTGEITWNFVAKNVIDFAWTADPDYIHDIVQMPEGPEIHFFYQPGEKTTDNWKKVQVHTVKHFQFMNKMFGRYPYEKYSVIQGGDGAMEYPMCTLMTGVRTFGSLVGTMAHEVSHSWYQSILASNESLYAWLDEGFADFTSRESLADMLLVKNDHDPGYKGYFALVKSGLQEPMNQHADHFSTNKAYSAAAYNMGEVFLQQLKYIIGEDYFYKGMRRYYDTWKFKHPEPNDFIRVMEKVSGLQLKWYLTYWTNTTKTIDYGIKSVLSDQNSTLITLERVGEFPMPVELMVLYTDNSKELLYIPLNETIGNKPAEDKSLIRIEHEPWAWVIPTYSVKISRPASEIASLEIDPSMRMADIERKNNRIDVKELLSTEKQRSKF